MLGTVQVKGMANLSCSAVSGDGQFLVLSDSCALLLFHLNKNSGGGDDSGQMILVPSKISVPLPKKMSSIGALRFSTNNLLLLATTDGRVRVISISPLDDDDTIVTTMRGTMCLRYNSMLYMDFIGEHEMVVVEQSWLNVVATFPDALQRKVYAT